MTDEQSLRRLIESFAQMRSVRQQRKLPRFPTPAALRGEVGARGFDGLLVCDRRGDLGKTKGATTSGDGEDLIRGVHIVDFSEGGFQLQLKCNDLSSMLRDSLFLEIKEARIPVLFRWCKQAGSLSRGGFYFVEPPGSNCVLAKLLSDLNLQLVQFLINSFKDQSILKSDQAGVFTCFSIYNGLRMLFLEALAAINDLTGDEGRLTTWEAIAEIVSDLKHFSDSHLEQASRLNGDPEFDRFIGAFLKPFTLHGCGLLGTDDDVVFLETDAAAVVLNSIFFMKEEHHRGFRVLPVLRPLYQSFLDLRALFPGIFDDPLFEDQFRHYSAVINELGILRDKAVDVLSCREIEGKATGSKLQNRMQTKSAFIHAREAFSR